MPHIHTQPGQIDMTATAFIVLRGEEAPKVLLHQHKKFNMLLAPGGHVELNETPWAAIAHEITEEAGYTLDELFVLQPALRIAQHDEIVVHPQPVLTNTHPVSSDHYHADTGYLFVTDHKPKSLPHEGESQDLRWYTRDEIAALSTDVLWEHSRHAILSIFDDFLDAWEPVAATDFSITNDPKRNVHE